MMNKTFVAQTVVAHENENYQVIVNDKNYTLLNRVYGVKEKDFEFLIEALYAAEQFNHALKNKTYIMSDEIMNPLLNFISNPEKMN